MIVKNKSDGYAGVNERDAGRIRPMPELYLSILLLICLGFQAATGVAQEAASSLLTTNSPFVLYLQDPPWIKEMFYVESQFWEAGPAPGTITKKGCDNRTNRVAIQPSGFFFEPLSSSSGGEARFPTERIIQGSSGHYYWGAHKDQRGGEQRGGESSLALSSKLKEEGASKENLSSIIGQNRKERIEQIRCFGLPSLRANTFKIAGYDQFEAQTADGFLLEGKILTASNNRPFALTYILGGGTDDVFSINYSYRSGEELPYYFMRQELRNGDAFGDPHTNWIEYVNYGTDVAITNGYSPYMFFTNLTIFNHLLIESNGHRYVIAQNGKRNPVDESSPHPLPGKSGEKTHSRLFSPFFWLRVGLLLNGESAFAISKGKSSKTNITKQKGAYEIEKVNWRGFIIRIGYCSNRRLFCEYKY